MRKKIVGSRLCGVDTEETREHTLLLFYIDEESSNPSEWVEIRAVYSMNQLRDLFNSEPDSFAGAAPSLQDFLDLMNLVEGENLPTDCPATPVRIQGPLVGLIIWFIKEMEAANAEQASGSPENNPSGGGLVN